MHFSVSSKYSFFSLCWNRISKVIRHILLSSCWYYNLYLYMWFALLVWLHFLLYFIIRTVQLTSAVTVVLSPPFTKTWTLAFLQLSLFTSSFHHIHSSTACLSEPLVQPQPCHLHSTALNVAVFCYVFLLATQLFPLILLLHAVCPLHSIPSILILVFVEPGSFSFLYFFQYRITH